MTARFTSLLITVVLAGAFMPRHVTPASAAGAVAGTWTWSIHASCVVTKANKYACLQLSTMGMHAYDLKTTSLSYSATDHLVVDARGHFSERGSQIVTGHSSGGIKLKLCDPSLMETRLFRGTCRSSWTGHGHIQKGGTNLPDFFTDSGKLTWPTTRETFFETYGAIGDTLIPAVPGTYDTHRYLSLVAYEQYVPGITYTLIVKRG